MGSSSFALVIDADGPVPVYVQIADVIEEQIRSGDLAPGRRIPSETDIRQTFGVARETARRAVAVLRERGVVYTVPHRGTYVGSPMEKPGSVG
jgi:DNA-binding GntR family transcriptional regulator